MGLVEYEKSVWDEVIIGIGIYWGRYAEYSPTPAVQPVILPESVTGAYRVQTLLGLFLLSLVNVQRQTLQPASLSLSFFRSLPSLLSSLQATPPRPLSPLSPLSPCCPILSFRRADKPTRHSRFDVGRSHWPRYFPTRRGCASWPPSPPSPSTLCRRQP